MADEKPLVQSAPSRPRLFYIDNLRILLTVLVILHHLAVGYGGPGGWWYREQGQMGRLSFILMSVFLAINQSFFMGFFFMISSYFSPGSYDRKGAAPYVKDRLKRLGIPLLFYLLVISPLLSYRLARHDGSRWSLARFLRHYVSNYRGLAVGPLWFLEALLIFSILYVLWRQLTKPVAAPPQVESGAPSNLAIAAFALLLGLLTFAVRIRLPVGWEWGLLGFQFPHFVQYIALYVVGLVAYRRQWFAGLSAAQTRVWCRAVPLLVVLFLILFATGGPLGGDLRPLFGGLRWQALAYALWEQFMGVAMVVTLLVGFRNRFNRQGPLARRLSGAAYATYIFHQPVIILLALALSDIRLDLALKWLLVAPLAVSLCFLVGYVVKSLPLARDIL
jgi:peptidoglycan/LPS O-acetylase OafA/YrhL